MRALLFISAAGLMGAAAACAPMPEDGGVPSPHQCDADDASSLIGSHVGAVTFAPDKPVRIVCTTCPTTKDYRPDRLNVRFNQETGIIEKVDCG